MTTPSTPAFLPPELIARFEVAARARGFRVEQFGGVAGCPLIALTRRTAGLVPRIYLSAGIHGDEPAPPLALFEMLEAGVFDARATWFICPLLNPAGFPGACRSNAEGVDLNRDYRHLVSAEIRAHVAWLERQPAFDLSLCMHEDWESTGFYLYELNPDGRPTLADHIIAAVAAICPIEAAALIDGHESSAHGIIRPAIDPLQREQWAEAIYLLRHHTRLSYTLETPSALPLKLRVQTMRAAVETAIANLPPRSRAAETTTS